MKAGGFLWVQWKKFYIKKREVTEKHIKQLQQEGKQNVRYTAMMPDIPFLVLGLFSDVGWIVHLIAWIICFCRNGFHHVLDYIALIALAGVVVGGFLNFAFGLPIYLSFKKGIFYGVK